MKVRPAVVLSRNDAVLLMQYQYGDTTVFALPGGNPDPGEDLEATLERELMEELGVEIQVFQLLFCGVVTRPNQPEDVLHCVFIGEIFGGEPVLNADHTTAAAVVWKPIADLDDLAMYPSVASAIQEHHAALLPTTYLGYIDQPFYG
ncbi:NUDIX hydrolase [Fibrella sp. HMF5335]|uniref:NUDIX hydrolase n=1 Tax=Fibrella rubiginis TaxID=2817060 RepID=A0A939GJ60_9BACT|nr:NUDIX hydrolase [Fibrella rubiginis]MBO0937731.1 NUDIX hydrolase [Fibrella rubiginis]